MSLEIKKYFFRILLNAAEIEETEYLNFSYWSQGNFVCKSSLYSQKFLV